MEVFNMIIAEPMVQKLIILVIAGCIISGMMQIPFIYGCGVAVSGAAAYRMHNLVILGVAVLVVSIMNAQHSAQREDVTETGRKALTGLDVGMGIIILIMCIAFQKAATGGNWYTPINS